MINDLLNKVSEKTLLDSIYNSIVVTSNKLEEPGHPKILYANKAFERITGYTAQEVIGKTPRILQGEKTDRAVINRLKQTLKKGEYFEGTSINYKKDGTPYNVQWNITPIFDDNGGIDCYFCVQKDITQSIKYEKHLEKRVKEEVEKVKLKDELLQKQSRLAALGEMMDAVAHQWLNPLSSIKMSMEMAKYLLNDNNIKDDNLKSYLDMAINNAHHLEETLQEFRGFFRPIDSMDEVFLNNIINDVLKLMKDELIINDITIKNEIADNIKVRVAPNEFKHVLINLFYNSKDAFDENGIINREIKLETVSKNDNLYLKVSDNAGGIPKNIIAKIFDQHITTKARGNGTGIGLYMTKQILDKYNMDIKVENINNGACFTIGF